MASLFKQKKSPFWWVKFKNSAADTVRVSTKLRFDLKSESKRAQKLCDDLARKEKQTSEQAHYGDIWEKWVPAFLEQRYGDSPKTLLRYRNCWRNVMAFLRKHNLRTPRALTRQHVREFVEWRQRGDRELGIFKGAKNTALTEIKVLRIVLNEAVASEFVGANVCFALGIKKAAPKVKPEITDAEHARILDALAHEPEWMNICYRLAWEQGWRFSETCFALDAVDLKIGAVWIKLKGGKLFPAPLFPASLQLLKTLIKQGKTHTYAMPKMTSKAWWKFFKRTGLRHLCFHCTRVSRINRLKRAGYGEEARMMIVGHQTRSAHSGYLRETVDPALLSLVSRLGNGDGEAPGENRIVKFSLELGAASSGKATLPNSRPKAQAP